MDRVNKGMNTIIRCPWCGDDPLYMQYHDQEWGVAVHDERLHFEFLMLEGAQAGLSWLTVLRKRENYRSAFDNFDPHRIAAYSEKKITSLLTNCGIIRNRRKIESAVNNAQRFIQIQQQFGSFDHYIWSFVEGKPVVNRWKELAQIPATTPLSDTISKDMRKRGFSFVGSTIIYAHMQAIGMVNDHLIRCFRYKEVLKHA